MGITGLVNILKKSELENGDLVRGFTHEKGWIFPVRYVNVYQRVKYVEIHI